MYDRNSWPWGEVKYLTKGKERWLVLGSPRLTFDHTVHVWYSGSLAGSGSMHHTARCAHRQHARERKRDRHGSLVSPPTSSRDTSRTTVAIEPHCLIRWWHGIICPAWWCWLCCECIDSRSMFINSEAIKQIKFIRNLIFYFYLFFIFENINPMTKKNISIRRKKKSNFSSHNIIGDLVWFSWLSQNWKALTETDIYENCWKERLSDICDSVFHRMLAIFIHLLIRVKIDVAMESSALVPNKYSHR